MILADEDYNSTPLKKIALFSLAQPPVEGQNKAGHRVSTQGPAKGGGTPFYHLLTLHSLRLLRG